MTTENALVPFHEARVKSASDMQSIARLEKEIEDLKANHDLQMKAVHYEAEKTIVELQCRLTQTTQTDSNSSKSP